MELVFFTGNVYDGRYANNGWLQELPDPVSKVAWDNPALISPRTAKRLDLNDGDMVRIEAAGHTLDMAVFITPGTADNVLALALGYGRKQGRVAKDVGFNTYNLRMSNGLGFASVAKMSKLGDSYELANTQHHGSMEGRPILREATLAEYKGKAEYFPKQPEHPPLIPLWNPHTYNEGYQWGMSIDLNACVGCGACTVACQAENNIPIVGKKQVRNGREMQWMRLDRYFAGEPSKPLVAHQPMPCQQCENAPCEEVCPVGATMHDEEGLNVMVYNRCIGTRYCSNNCPYKVRHFNFFNYTKDKPETEKMLMNPDVTVRSRGVMEKCTYCIQRISRTKINAKNEGREVKDGEIVTACQQVCPVDAIVFGNINDPNSRVSKLKNLNRDYSVLVELNTKPRTTYLAKLRNPNPEFEGKENG
jgi:molybdopterin-containing oxidoreductase family iron-sulfur binding subunit